MGKLSPSRFAEFFEGGDGRLSMTRLIVFLTWPPATWVVLKQHEQLANYLGAYVIGYALGKFAGEGNASTTQILETPSDSVSLNDGVDAREPDSQPQVRARKANRNSRGSKAK